MGNKNYLKGRRLEYEARKILLAEYPVVMRTAGSHVMFDIIAVGKDTLFIQVKSSRSESLKALQGILDANLDDSNRYEVWWKDKGKWHKIPEK